MIEYKPSIFSWEQLIEKAKSLPLSPGVYLFYDRNGNILYVGKSKALHNRVLSYFLQTGKHNAKTLKLVRQIADFETIFTSTEKEALILENEKIKLHRPKFNIRLKDDKDYPYIRLSAEETYPRLTLVHRKEKKNDRSLYFGPYSSASAVRSILDMANTLFCLPTCKRKFPSEIGKERPCLYYHMKRCVGVCTGEISPREYQKRMEEVLLFLRYDHKKILSRLEKEMAEAAEALDFERAANARDRIQALRQLSEKQQVVRDLHFDADVFGVFQDDLGGCVNVITVREGHVVDSTNFHFGADEMITGESFSSWLLDFYRGKDMMPRQVLLPGSLFEDDIDPELLSDLLSRGERKLKIRSAQRGEGRKLLLMADSNAKAAAEHRRAQLERDEEVLVKLASALHLEVVPQRIESIDISNSGSQVVSAGIICVENAKFSKKNYKSFLLERSHPDDPDCMYEAVFRRLRRFQDKDESFSPLPDLFLVDGGILQVKAVQRALSEFNYEIPVFGMVKDAFHKTRNLTDGENDISILYDPQLFQFIYKIQEEVHRFSFSRMDSRRRKTVKSSSLSKIPGIGEKKAALLLKAFESLQKIKTASKEELVGISGISAKDAEAVYFYFHGK